MNLGQSYRGVSLGPEAIRIAGIRERLEQLSYCVHDLGDVSIAQKNHDQVEIEDNLKNLNEIALINQQLAEIVDKEIMKKQFPLILGGDHSVAIGSLAGVAKHYKNLGIIWYDAHGDMNSAETSPSGNIHGMPLAVNLGIGHEKLTHILGYKPKIKPENIVIIGARSLDKGEVEMIHNLGIRMYTMSEINRLGMKEVMTETVQYLLERSDGIHLSLDLDALDPAETPGVGTPVNGGISYEDSYLAMQTLFKSGSITSAELVEVNPMLDDKNKTATIAVDLALALFGEQSR